MDNITFPMLFASFFEQPESVTHFPLMALCPLSLVFECRELSTQWMKFFDVDQTFIKLEVMDILVPESLHYLTNKKNPQLN